MKAIVRDRYGTSSALELRDVEQPTPGKGEVLIAVRAAGLARGVLHVMTGTPYLMRIAGFGVLRPKRPVIGMDVAGTVVAVGPETSRFEVGDEVFGIAAGSFAEFAVAREDKLAVKPAALSFEQAAAMPVSGLTALRALDASGATSGSTVLVVGASGGVGTYIVQIAVALGAKVTGVASTPKLDLVLSLGAAAVIDYTTKDFADSGDTYDVVIDIGGMTSLSRLRRALTPHGTLVIVGGENGGTWNPGMGRQLAATVLSPFVGQRLTSVLNKEHYTGLERLAELVETGALTPSIERNFALVDAPEAVRRLETGSVRGQVVITI